MPRNIKVVQVKVPVAPRTKKLPRGKPGAPQLRPYHFKKGASGNPGGKPKVLQKFSEMIAARLLMPCPPLIAKQLTLPPGATNYDALIAAQILNGTLGDNTSFMNLHNIVEGLLPTKNLNLSVSAEAFLQDPGFRDFLQQNHKEYLSNGQASGTTIDAALPGVPAAETED